MATDKDYWAEDPPDFDQRLMRAESICMGHVFDWPRSPFWQFLDGLSWALLGAPLFESADQWGWSNLLKIGWSVGNPSRWRRQVPTLEKERRDVCIVALREEFAKLRNSLIVVASAYPLGVLDSPELFPKADSAMASKI